jgi:hypothetical protein
MIATARTEPPESYSSLAHLYPLAPFVPMAATDMAHDGTSGVRPALITFWTDPMEIHTFIGYADYGFRSGEFGGELVYMNNYLPFTLTFRGRYLFGFQGVIADRPYFQRDRGYGVEGGLSFPGANTFGYLSSVTVGLRRRLLEPWNAAADSTPQQGTMPTEAHLTEATIGVKYSTPNMFLQGSWVRSEPAIGSDRQYTRVTADYAISHAMDFHDITVLFGIRGAAHWGPQLPQEFLGFQKYDQFQGGFSLPRLVDPWSNQTDYRVRGIRTYRYGDRLLMGSIGVAWQPDWLVRNLPLLRPLDPQLVYFIEGGAVWNSEADSPAISSRTADISYGLELRSSLFNDLWLSAGAAFGKSGVEHPDLYIRLETGR